MINNEENLLALYLDEINRIPLLTREEEDSIARKPWMVIQKLKRD
ncbi:sigma-70 factor domain-containing protein [Thiospirochaeta perfilievii]